MTTRPWMPLYIGDYLADTAHLTATEHGAYLLLLMHHWQHGSLPADDELLTRIARVHPPHWPRVKRVLSSFFTTQEDGSWKNKRLAAELDKANDVSRKRAIAARQRHIISKAIADASENAIALQLHTHARAVLQPQLQEGQSTPPTPPDGGASTPPPSVEPKLKTRKAAGGKSADDARKPVKVSQADVNEAMRFYNDLAQKLGWPIIQARFVTGKRETELRRRLADHGLTGWKAVAIRASKSDFLNGRVPRDEAHRNWRFKFDCLCSEAWFNKIASGNYDNADRSVASAGNGATGFAALSIALREREAANGVSHDDEQDHTGPSIEGRAVSVHR